MKIDLTNFNRYRNLHMKKFFLAPIFWCGFLVVLPTLYAHLPIYLLPLYSLPAVYLGTMQAFLIHESWHLYARQKFMPFLYHLYNVILISDPQSYFLTHAEHHAHANSIRDIEFYPFGRIENRKLRFLHNFLDLFIGAFYTGLARTAALRKHRKYKTTTTALSTAASIALYAVLFLLSHAIFGVEIADFLIPYFFVCHMISLLVRHTQLLEHGGLFLDDDQKTRDMKTRNLRPEGWPARFFLFMTQSDSKDHLLHHIRPTSSKSQNEDKTLPEDAILIHFKDYVPVLKDLLLAKY